MGCCSSAPRQVSEVSQAYRPTTLEGCSRHHVQVTCPEFFHIGVSEPQSQPDHQGKVTAQQPNLTLMLIDASPPVSPVERVDLFADGRAFVLQHVLSPAECEWYISVAQQLGMQTCQEDGYDVRVRVCDRVAASSDELASRLFDRIAQHLAPLDLTGAREWWPEGVARNYLPGIWLPRSVNEMFRICRYEPGGHFAPHIDGGHSHSTVDRSVHHRRLRLASAGWNPRRDHVPVAEKMQG
jgi:hypothetical protein